MTPTTLRQLALIKYMFQQGVAQSKQPSPLFVVALLNFQDAAELFLHHACENHRIAVPAKVQFLEYWRVLAPLGAVRHEPGMDRLNRARVAFKHHGNLPNEQDMEVFRVTAGGFFEENTPLLFGTKFEDVSLVDLVSCAATRDYLKTAETHWVTSKEREARDSIALAFSSLLRDFSARRTDTWGRDPFAFGPSIPSGLTLMRADRPDLRDRELRKFIETTTEAVEELQRAVRLLAYGLDYPRFARFSALTPTVSWMTGESPRVNQGMRQPKVLTKEGFDFCFGFVIECAVKLQQFEYGT